MKEYKLLNYRDAYWTVITMIDKEYWQLEDKQENPAELFASLKLPDFQAQEDGQKNRGFWSSSGSVGKCRLNQFLTDVHAVQDTHREGCIVLFRFIKAIFDSREGRHFPYVLAKAVVALLEDPQIHVKPQIVFQGEKAEQLEQEVDLLNQSARNVIFYYRMFHHPDNFVAAYQTALLQNNLMTARFF